MILRSVPLGNPAPGTQPPFGTWKFIPPNGVQTSFNPATGHGAIHTMTITGDFVSAFMEDIELDIGIEQKPWRVNCADGLCASMKYTVVEMDDTRSGFFKRMLSLVRACLGPVRGASVGREILKTRLPETFWRRGSKRN